MKLSKVALILLVISVEVHQFDALSQNKISLASDWTLMANYEIDYSLDYATVEMDSTSSVYQLVEIKMKEGRINIYESTVFFKDGFRQENHHQPLELEFDQKLIQLKGNEKIIDRIAIKFDRKDKIEDKSVVEFWGRI